MLRSSLVATGAAMLCAVASAQNLAHKSFPVTAPLKDAGVYNMQTGKFTTHAHSGSLGAAQQTVFDNTCNNASGYWYVGLDFCEDYFDEGRIPASGPVGATADNNTNTWQIGYCTSTATGAVDVDWEVFDTTVGGTDSCTLFSAGAPADFTAGIVGFDSSAAGFPLPGSTTGGLACWLVTFSSTTPVCQKSGATSADLFNFRFRLNNSNPSGAAQGLLIKGDQTTPAGSNTYNIPPVTDPILGVPCGSGLDEQDLWWDNVDNTPVGGTPSCPGGIGTNCYWFGGSPTNPFGGFYFHIESAGACSGCNNALTAYCTAKTNSNGCLPAISLTSGPIAMTGASSVTLNNLSEKPGAASHIGQVFWNTVGPNGAPFNGGFLCVKGPGIVRIAPAANYGGTAGATTCLGSLSQNLNASLAAHPAQASAGMTVYVQGWARDTAAFQGIQLSAAFSAVICP